MKALAIVLVYCAWASSALAQGTLMFETNPTNVEIVYPSHGLFTLSGITLEYEFRAPYSWDMAEILGPGMAHSGQDAPVIFELNLRGCEPPLIPGRLGACYYEGALTLSDDQITELVSGQWYVKSFVSFNPAHPLEGQITLVPEPSLGIWGVLGAMFLACYARRPKFRKA